MSARAGRLVALATVGLLAAASSAHACAVCGLGGTNRIQFLVTTLILSLLPLGMIAAGLVWLARNARNGIADEFVDRDEVEPKREVEVAKA